jgi:diketogulonate reductase-like aldo/keto reductase
MHFGAKAMKKACYKSLNRLGIDCLDLYLVHFPSFTGAKIQKHMKIMEELLNEGKTRYIGVSNYSVKQFKEAQGYLKDARLVTNQLICNLTKQKHIKESLPYYQKEGVTLTAYSPLGHKGFTSLKGELREKLEKIADANSATIQQIAIAWLINHDNVITIPKTFNLDHLHSNYEATNMKLSEEEMKLLQSI